MTEYYSLVDEMMPSSFEEYASKRDFYDYMRTCDLLIYLEEALDDQKQILDDVEDIRKESKSMLKSGIVIGAALGIGITLGIVGLIKRYKKKKASKGN